MTGCHLCAFGVAPGSFGPQPGQGASCVYFHFTKSQMWGNSSSEGRKVLAHLYHSLNTNSFFLKHTLTLSHR